MRLREWGVDPTKPDHVCHFAYLESTVAGYVRRNGSLPPPEIFSRHLPTVDVVAPTLPASPSCHPFLFGPVPTFLGSRALLSKQGIPPGDSLYAALLPESPRLSLRALGRGVHFLSASAVVHLVQTEHSSPLCGLGSWRYATAFTGADTFGAAVRAHAPGSTLLSASEVSHHITPPYPAP